MPNTSPFNMTTFGGPAPSGPATAYVPLLRRLLLRGRSAPAAATTLRRAVYAALLADPGVAAVAGARIFPGYRPQSGRLPAITYRVASNPRVLSLVGQAGMGMARVQVDCWAATLPTADALKEAVRLCFAAAGRAGSLAGLPVTVVVPKGEVDLTEDPADGTDQRPYHVAFDWLIHHRESVP